MNQGDNIIRLAELQENGEIPPAAEDAIALTFADRHWDQLRFVAKWGAWFDFDGVHWALDETLHIFDRVRTLCREVAGYCDRAATAIASGKTVSNVERLARSDRRLAATAEQWDGNAWLFNAGEEADDNGDL
jgi:putative DNA primase/helicase